jgi:RNA polymerase sigma-70 factor (ECF subfamily)
MKLRRAGPTVIKLFVSMSKNSTDRTKELVLLMTQHQRRIFSYIYTLVPDRASAEDILQETSLVICEKFGDFRTGTDFVAWACQIAWWQVRAARTKFARSKVVFDDKVLEAVAATAAELAPEQDARHEALARCLQKLNPRDRELLMTRYESGVEEAARRTGRSMVAAYKALARLRKLLHDCVTNQLASEAAA